MAKYLLLPLISLCCWCAAATAQEDSIIRNITANLAESLPEAEDLSELTDRLSFYRRHPIDVNHAAPEQLKELVFLSALQISNFYLHLKSNGPFKDLLELQAIDEFDLATIGRLMFFVTLQEENRYLKLNLHQLVHKSNNEILWRYGQTLEQQKGYHDLPGSHYMGGPQKLLLKYRYDLDDLFSLSFAADKDAGETFLKGNNKSGFDFLAGSIALHGKRFKKIIVGDYSLQFGQGLTLWTGSSFGKGPDVAGVAKKDTGLKPYTSTNELSFFRGMASDFNLTKTMRVTGFISSRKLDASLTEIPGKESVLMSIGSSGLHRTATEIQNKGDVKQLLYGASADFNSTSLDAGIVAYHTSYSHAFVAGKQRYRQYSFQGKELTNAGLYYNYTFKNIYFFGETAKSAPGGIALLNGVMSSLSAHLSTVLLYREYSKDYHNFYSQALGAGADAANEKGIYMGIHSSRGTQWNSSLYADIYHFPWAKYRIDSASSGLEIMYQLSYTPRKNLSFLVKASTKSGAQNVSAALPVNPVSTTQKNNYRLEVQWKVSQRTALKNRLEITQYRKGQATKTNGYMLYQDIDYSPISSRFRSNFRIAIFNISNYDNRIYAYEDDVLGGAGSGLYNGRGIRTYLNLNYRLKKQLRMWFRYAVNLYPGEEKTGSALDEITGNRKSDVRIQLRYQF